MKLIPQPVTILSWAGWPGSNNPFPYPTPLILLAGLLGWISPLAFGGEEVAPAASRQVVSLNGEWLFQRDGAPAEDWKTVQVPSSFEEHEGIEFDGVGWYRKSIPPFPLPEGKRVLLHIQAAATGATVWWNGQEVGNHLGGWTPFRLDVTELVRQSPPDQAHEVRLRLDEMVGHNTQGFLPIIAPHFGGLWQEVRLLLVPDAYCDDLRVLAVGHPASGELDLEIPLLGPAAASVSTAGVRYRLLGQTSWRNLTPTVRRQGQALLIRAALPDPQLWSPAEPNLYDVEISLPGNKGDRITARAAFRSIAVFGQSLRLNGQPLSIRGLLNWGYSPPQTAPNPGETAWRRELEMARARGFNLMKFCLWLPPKRYLELADETGFLTWMEYPTWHPTLTGKFLDPLRREFSEFFCYDRNHPSVVLRSLTCETGPGAELGVIQSLYDLAHTMIPGAVVEDDSSWIGWNRVHDFYDDHPYGNNHTWPGILEGFREYILAHGLKPLVLGEAMAADTWVDREAVLGRLGDSRPWWAPGPLDAMAHWQEQMTTVAGSGGLNFLRSDSLRYGLLMRKYQAETFRREIPYGGYVITVIRDIPNASMGLVDYLDQPKWTEADWAWHRETICLLQTEKDRRSFQSGEQVHAGISLSHFGQVPIAGGRLEVTLETAHAESAILSRWEKTALEQNPGTLARLLDLDWTTPAVSKPTELVIRTLLKTSQGDLRNHWAIWAVPGEPAGDRPSVQRHASLAGHMTDPLFAGAASFQADRTNQIAVAARFDESLVQFLEAGGRVLFLPDGQKNSLPLSEHWFLRGAPYIPESALSPDIPRDFFVDLQHFDLASAVVPNIPYRAFIDPILMLWDTHDLKTVKTHGLIFETQAGQGRLLVSAVRHDGPANAAGPWLLGVLLEHLQNGPAPKHALPAEMWAHLKNQLRGETVDLVEKVWRFKPDPQDAGLSQGWHEPKLKSEQGWREIRIGRAWESQGYPALDRWAWYRLEVDVPSRWQGQDVFLSFEGVDDIYELYVNGRLAGKGGDLVTRQDAFNEKKSHNITPFVKPGETALLAVRVHDWYGAGGIFRPVTLGTIGFSPGLEMLK